VHLGPPHAYATLSIILPDDTDPEAVTAALHITPSSVRRRGTPLSKPSGRGKPRHETALTSFWCLSSSGAGLSNEAQEHVDWLLTQLVGREDTIRDLVAKGYSVGVWHHWFAEHGTPTIRDETSRRLDELGMTLDLQRSPRMVRSRSREEVHGGIVISSWWRSRSREARAA